MFVKTSFLKKEYNQDSIDGRVLKKDSSRFCNYCKKEGHTKDVCFKLVGYPDWYKGPRENSNAPRSVKSGINWNKKTNSVKTAGQRKFIAQV